MSVAFISMLYQVLTEQEKGPRFGSFAALYGGKRDAGGDREGAEGGAYRQSSLRGNAYGRVPDKSSQGL